MLNKRIISSQKILDNLEVFKSRKVCAMVKGNAYGFGLEGIVKLIKNKVEYFGVANIEEALQVRTLAPDNNILIVGRCFEGARCKDNNIEYTICDENDALFAPKGAKVHLKIDSGFHRLGFNDKERFLTAIDILRENSVEIKGVFTHFATLDCDEDYFNYQLSAFRNFLSVMPKDLKPIIHVGGSWSLGKFIPEADMIRIGKGLYHGAISITSRLIRVFEIKKGDRVGYSNGFIADRDMRVGIVPLGYADGLKRTLAGKYSVMIADKKCKIVGNICMDMFAVDVSDVNAFVGKRVEVLYDERDMAR